MTVINCDNCEEPIDVTADNVTLPYNCGCTDLSDVSDDIYGGTKQPASLAPDEISMDEVLGNCKPSGDFETVENTTLLIEDLEKQLADEQSVNDDLRQQIADIAKDNVVLRDQLSDAQIARTDAETLLAQVREKLDVSERRALLLTGMIKGIMTEVIA